MKILIRRVREQKGTIVFIDRRLEVPTLRIGRGTEQDLELADARVPLALAEIAPIDNGQWRVEARAGGTGGVWVNGTPCAAATLAIEDRIDAGHYRITLMAPPDGTDLALLVEETAVVTTAEDIPAVGATRLDETRLSRRGVAWAGFLLVLSAFLLLPMYLRYGADEAKAASPIPLLPSHTAWNSGPLSSAHAYVESECEQCHVKPFERVQNQACLACHASTRHHVPTEALAALPDFAAAQCTDCHREHNGADGTIVRLASLCTDCHENLQPRFPESPMETVRDFSTTHPPFSPVLARFDPARRVFEPIAMIQGKAPLREDNGLVFPHDLHLDAKGIDAPEGTRVLECDACHVPDRGKIGFEPITMERHCADCHRLEFDPEDLQRVVPHGQPAEVAAVIRDHHAAKALDLRAPSLGALPNAPERRRPGPPRTREEREFIARWTAAEGDRLVREVFDGRLCRYCHVVQETGDPRLPWDVAPVNLQEHALSGAQFVHGAHEASACTDCHAATTSNLSTDVLLPDIENCRACHGDPGHGKQVTNTCIDCHAYHADTGVHWAPALAQTRRPTAAASTGDSR